MNSRRPKLGDPLSEIELEILQYLANGLAFRDVAQVRGRSLSTVSDQADALRLKLGACNIPNAVALGMRKGLIK